MNQNDYDIYVLSDYSLQNIFSNDLSLEKFRNIKSKMHCVKYHKPWCQNTKHVFNVFLLTKTSRGLECNPYIQKFDHPLQNTTKYVVLQFCCCAYPQKHTQLWYDEMFAMSYLILAIMRYLNDVISVHFICFSFPGFFEYLIELHKNKNLQLLFSNICVMITFLFTEMFELFLFS